MPVPNRGETKRHFISRCIPIVINEGTTKDPKQAAAICYSIWEKHRKKHMCEKCQKETDCADYESFLVCLECDSVLTLEGKVAPNKEELIDKIFKQYLQDLKDGKEGM